ncbi:unnamed protein product, partial [Cyprideis torosa]
MPRLKIPTFSKKKKKATCGKCGKLGTTAQTHCDRCHQHHSSNDPCSQVPDLTAIEIVSSPANSDTDENRSLPPSSQAPSNDKFEQLRNVLPRFYQPVDRIAVDAAALIPAPARLAPGPILLAMGSIPALIPPDVTRLIRFVPGQKGRSFIERLSQRFPSGSYASSDIKQPVSKDANVSVLLEEIKENHAPDVVLTPSVFRQLLTLTLRNAENWKIPVEIREIGGRHVVLFDSSLPPPSITRPAIQALYMKKAVETFFTPQLRRPEAPKAQAQVPKNDGLTPEQKRREKNRRKKETKKLKKESFLFGGGEDKQSGCAKQGAMEKEEEEARGKEDEARGKEDERRSRFSLVEVKISNLGAQNKERWRRKKMKREEKKMKREEKKMEERGIKGRIQRQKKKKRNLDVPSVPPKGMQGSDVAVTIAPAKRKKRESNRHPREQRGYGSSGYHRSRSYLEMDAPPDASGGMNLLASGGMNLLASGGMNLLDLKKKRIVTNSMAEFTMTSGWKFSEEERLAEERVLTELPAECWHRLQPPPAGQNVVYKLWRLSRQGHDSLNLIFRERVHAMQWETSQPDVRTIITPTFFSSKLEHQMFYGVETLSMLEALKEWTYLFLHPDSKVIRIRVDPNSNELVMLESVDQAGVEKCLNNPHPLSEIPEIFNPQQSLKMVSSLLLRLRKLTPGQYLLSFSVKDRALGIHRGVPTPPGFGASLDLHALYNPKDPVREAPLLPHENVPWRPVDTEVLSPFQKLYNRIPATFHPCPNRGSMAMADQKSRQRQKELENRKLGLDPRGNPLKKFRGRGGGGGGGRGGRGGPSGGGGRGGGIQRVDTDSQATLIY